MEKLRREDARAEHNDSSKMESADGSLITLECLLCASLLLLVFFDTEQLAQNIGVEISFNFLTYVVSLSRFRMNNKWECFDKCYVNTNRKQVPIIESIYVSYLFIMDASDPISSLGNGN